MSQLSFIFLLLLGIFSSHIYANELVSLSLCDFNDQAACANWIPMAENLNKLSLNTDKKYINSGEGSGQLYFPVAGSGEHRWPRVTMEIPESKRDWRDYDLLQMVIFNPRETDGRLGWNVYTEDGNVYSRWTAPVPPGKSMIDWPLPEGVRKSFVTRFLFSVGDPVEEYTLYVDDLQLALSSQSLGNRVDSLLHACEVEVDLFQWENGNLHPELRQLQKKLQRLKNSTPDLLQSSKQFHALYGEYAELKKKLYQRLQGKTLEKFKDEFPGKPWGYGWCPGSMKVYREDLPYCGEIGSTPQIALARRDRESFQIVLRSFQNIEQVRVAVEEFRHSDRGEAVHGICIQPMLVGHVRSPEISPYPVEQAAWRPDPLLLIGAGFPLDQDVWQAVWVDVTTEANAVPGIYRGNIRVHAEGLPDLVVPFAVEVWDFAVPEKPTQPLLVNFCTDSNHRVYSTDQNATKEFFNFKEGKITFEKLSPEARRLREIEIATEMLLLDNLITPTSLYVSTRRQAIEDVRRWMENRGNFLNITYVFPATLQKELNWPQQRLFANLADQVPELEQAGFLKNSYLYAYDELTEDKFSAAVEILQEVKKMYPQIPIITTAYDREFGSKNGFDKVIDIWCPQIERFVEQIDEIRKLQKAGKKVWYYSCLWDPGMDFLVEKPATAPRLMVGLAQHKYGSDGFLYYGVTSGHRDQKLIASGPLTDFKADKFNGCGLLVYPGAGGPLPSIRLKMVRDGIEDFEYWTLLKKMNREEMAKSDAEILDGLLSVPETLIKDLERYDLTGTALEAERRKAGNLLHKYRSQLP